MRPEDQIALLRQEVRENKREIAGVSADLGIASASFQILNEETRSKVTESLRQSEERRIELENLRLNVATKFASMEAKDEVEKEDRKDTKEHSTQLQRLEMKVENMAGDLLGMRAAESERKKNQQTLLLQSRKMRWSFFTAVALAVINGVFALLVGLYGLG